jgi:hypothetical protein
LLLSGLAGACACAGVKILGCWYRYSVLSDPLSSRHQALLAVI